jgi:hypothetical protein
MKVRGYMFNRVLKMQQESFISKMQDIPRRLSGRARSVITKKGLERKPFFKGLCRSLLGLTVYRMRLAILHMQNYWAITRLQDDIGNCPGTSKSEIQVDLYHSITQHY